jgi:hypothetical protein
MLERLAQVSVRLGAAPSSIGPSHHRRGCLFSTIATASARSGLRPRRARSSSLLAICTFPERTRGRSKH